MAMFTVHLLRHAAPERAAGIDDPGLSPEGHRLARDLTASLGTLVIRRVICSPSRRAVETIAPFVSATGIEMISDDRLRERETPYFERSEDFLEHVRESFDQPHRAFDSAEPMADAGRRARSCLEEALERPGVSEPGLLLTGHGQCLTALLQTFHEAAGFSFWQSLPMPAIIELEIDRAAGSGSFRLLEPMGGRTP